eukprot:3500578-Lingulodinium_polyedra.AAC.1
MVADDLAQIPLGASRVDGFEEDRQDPPEPAPLGLPFKLVQLVSPLLFTTAGRQRAIAGGRDWCWPGLPGTIGLLEEPLAPILHQ